MKDNILKVMEVDIPRTSISDPLQINSDPVPNGTVILRLVNVIK